MSLLVDRTPGERTWPGWALAWMALGAVEVLYLLLVFLPVQFGDVNRMAYATHLGGGGYPLYWWRGDSTLDPGLLYTLAQLMWLMLPLIGGPLLGLLAGATALAWPDAAPRVRLVWLLLLTGALIAFALAWTTWGAAQLWFYG